MFITNTQTSIGYVNNYDKIAIYKFFGKQLYSDHTCNMIHVVQMASIYLLLAALSPQTFVTLYLVVYLYNILLA